MYNVEYQTATGNDYAFQMGVATVETSAYLVDRRVTEAACKQCSNFGRGGGCPPKAPHFLDLRERYSQSSVIYLRMTTDQIPERIMKLPQRVFLGMVMQDAVLSRLMGGVAHRLKAEWSDGAYCYDCRGGYCTGFDRVCGGGVMILGQGHCMGCGRCNFKRGGECLNPTKRVFSLESTGVLVNALMRTAFGMETYWWANKQTPPYMVKTIAALYNEAPRDINPTIVNAFLSANGVKSIKEVHE